eukprot:TRINITY_DN110_c0_g1_i1.p1 TRINITY_DN110_c0_g1~~TRINITY_DN110_c0_g1_i1.p1  ORF type:complete len:226 (+),score=82.89 TRINITY_DN110_c0_g1_i1:31-708(+)
MAQSALDIAKFSKQQRDNLSRNTYDHLGSDVSDFAKKQMEKYGWKEGEGLGKNKDGIKTHVKTSKKDDSRGIGCTENPHEFDAMKWFDICNQTLKQVGNDDDNDSDSDDEPARRPTDDELFKACGGIRLGMRSQISQRGKWKRVETGAAKLPEVSAEEAKKENKKRKNAEKDDKRARKIAKKEKKALRRKEKEEKRKAKQLKREKREQNKAKKAKKLEKKLAKEQ